MPALFAHPAASVPFVRYGLSVSALIVGSMAPDFLYFFRLSNNAQYGHTLPGLFLFSLPMGLLVLEGFHLVLKYPLFLLLPTNHQERLSYFLRKRKLFSSGRELLLLLLALLLGACSHIIWDSCTHVYGWTVQHIALLRLPILTTSQGTLRVYKVLQHGGTLCGTMLLAVWYWKWFRQAPQQKVPEALRLSTLTRFSTLLFITGFASLLGISYGLYKVHAIHDLLTFRYFVVYTGKAGFAALFVQLLAFSIGLHALYFRGLTRSC
ncbi:MAG: DUF4184 family protein [bacterium]|nr:DUF4184 family protein [bacterium]